MKIVCGMDFGQHARAVARVATDLARHTGGSVELVHAIDPPSGHIQAPGVDIDALELGNRQRSEFQLAAEGRELAGESQVPVSVHVEEGEVEDVLFARCKEVGADLIVIGAHGRAALERLFLGSVAERIVRHAERPVVIVPPGSASLGDTTGAGRALRVMVALDGRRASEGGVEMARALRSRAACDVTFLRLYWPSEEYRRLGLSGARDFSAPDPDVVVALERALRSHVGELPGTGTTAYAIEPTWGDPATRIFVAASEHDADLVIMGAESRHGLARIAHPAVASRVARHAFGVPVLFVPAPRSIEQSTEVPRMLTVLAPTDLSPAGNRAVRFAYSLAAAHGGVVELCHVHERSLANPPYAYDRPEGKLTPEERGRIEAALWAIVPTDSNRLGIATRVTVIDGGKASEAIMQAGERFAADAIVLSSHGAGGGTHSLGSVSNTVVKQARRPVMVVPVKDAE